MQTFASCVLVGLMPKPKVSCPNPNRSLHRFASRCTSHPAQLVCTVNTNHKTCAVRSPRSVSDWYGSRQSLNASAAKSDWAVNIVCDVGTLRFEGCEQKLRFGCCGQIVSSAPRQVLLRRCSVTDNFKWHGVSCPGPVIDNMPYWVAAHLVPFSYSIYSHTPPSVMSENVSITNFNVRTVRSVK